LFLVARRLLERLHQNAPLELSHYVREIESMIRDPR
jgi:hypothetical protein